MRRSAPVSTSRTAARGLSRRTLLQAGAAIIGTPWPALQALAQSSSGAGDGYKALVCLFMFGGNDGNNLLVPTDSTRYAQYQRARPNLALLREQLQPVPRLGDYGLHPAMDGVAALVQSGRAAVLANIGPLMVPTTLAQFQNRSVPLPDSLFSHSDQQNAWQSSIHDSPGRSGWGGRTLERLVAEGASNRGYAALSVAGGNLWEAGDRSLSPYRVSSSGRFGFDFYEPGSTRSPLDRAISELLSETRSDPLQQAWLQVMGRSIDNQRILTSALQASTLQTPFPGSDLGRQLQMVARLIAARSRLGLARQCFFCSIGGFDTHGDDQMLRQNQLLGEISEAVTAFSAAMDELATAQQVTLFTASDFGRNLPSNGAGTDHGWGSHHLVVGAAVNGGRLYGRYPVLQVGGPDDVGQGVWLPALSSDQLGGELARWFGADAATTAEVFPRLRHFDANLGLMKG